MAVKSAVRMVNTAQRTVYDRGVAPATDDARGRRITIRDVAQRAGVSTAAASKVLRNVTYGVSPELRRRVETAMADLDYRPLASARGMRGKTYTIGVLVSDIQNPFFGILVEGITDAIATTGYDPLLGAGGTTPQTQSRVVNAMIDRQMDGLVLIAPVASAAELATVARRIPTVVIGRHGPSEGFDTVANDDIAGSRLIVDHLVDLGHERIAFLAHPGPEDVDERRPEVVRARGYRDAMTARGLADRLDVITTPWTHQGGQAAGRAIRARAERPTAVHAGADVAAYGLLSDLWESRLALPDDIAVAGYDNTPTAALAPVSLTSVDQSGLDMGRRAAELLLERIEGRNAPVDALTDPWLAVRSTTAGPLGTAPRR